MVRGGDSCSRNPGFESQHRILYGIFSHLLQKLNCLFEKSEHERKRGRERPNFKFKENIGKDQSTELIKMVLIMQETVTVRQRLLAAVYRQRT